MANDESGTPEVNWEDQQRINKFGKLNTQRHELQAEIKAKKKLVEDLEDASNELMITDETEIRYAIGECFVSMDNEETEARLTAASDEIKKDLETAVGTLKTVEGEMAQLKALLYGKFKGSINLEDD